MQIFRISLNLEVKANINNGIGVTHVEIFNNDSFQIIFMDDRWSKGLFKRLNINTALKDV